MPSMNILRAIATRAVALICLGARKALDAVIPADPAIAAIEALGLEEYKKLALEPRRLASGDGAISFFPYSEPKVRTGLVELKMRRNMRIARLIGAAIYEELVAEAADIWLFGPGSPPLLLPIPMARADLRARGWNQCELMLSEVKRRDRGGIFDVDLEALAKARSTGDQVGKSRRARLESLRGSFVADGAKVRGRDAIVFDDILTTGATLSEAKRALFAAGARRVLLSSAARAGA